MKKIEFIYLNQKPIGTVLGSKLYKKSYISGRQYILAYLYKEVIDSSIKYQEVINEYKKEYAVFKYLELVASHNINNGYSSSSKYSESQYESLSHLRNIGVR